MFELVLGMMILVWNNEIIKVLLLGELLIRPSFGSIAKLVEKGYTYEV